MTTRNCRECGTALAVDAHPLTRYCSPQCRYRHRDKTDERKAADAARHRTRYRTDAEHREQRRERDRARYRDRVGIPLDAPLSNRGRRRIDLMKETP